MFKTEIKPKTSGGMFRATDYDKCLNEGQFWRFF